MQKKGMLLEAAIDATDPDVTSYLPQKHLDDTISTAEILPSYCHCMVTHPHTGVQITAKQEFQHGNNVNWN